MTLFIFRLVPLSRRLPMSGTNCLGLDRRAVRFFMSPSLESTPRDRERERQKESEEEGCDIINTSAQAPVPGLGGHTHFPHSC